MFVSNCQSISNRVCNSILATDRACINSGNSLGVNVGMFFFFGFSKALPIPPAGLASINPQLTAKIMISFNRCVNLFTVSSAPLALTGSKAVISVRALISCIPTCPTTGKISRSSDRHTSRAWFAVILDCLILNHSVATFSKY